MKPVDIRPFAFPNCPAGEARFEESRDIERVEVVFAGSAPETAALQYLRKYWPKDRIENLGDLDQVRPSQFGWLGMDDQFTPPWVDAAVEVSRPDAHTLSFTFQPLRSELPDFPGLENYDVTFRRTLAVRVCGGEERIQSLRVYTRSQPTNSRLRVELHAGRRTPAETIAISGYNAVVEAITPGAGTRLVDGKVRVEAETGAAFELQVAHMIPAQRYAHDDGHLLITVGEEAFTISLTSLEAEGPIWFAELGVYIAFAADTETFAAYRARTGQQENIAALVSKRPEQSLSGALNGQPRAHPIPFCFGAKHARQKFWLTPCGDLVLTEWLVRRQPGADTPRYQNEGDGRFFFGLERWTPEARFNDPWPVMAYNIHCKRGDLRVRQQAFAVPLGQSILAGEPAADASMVALLRFRFENHGDRPVIAELPLDYAQRVPRSENRRLELVWESNGHERFQDDALIPLTPRESLSLAGNHLVGQFNDQPVVRAAFASDMKAETAGKGVRFRKQLQAGETCELLLRIPFVTPQTPAEMQALDSLPFERCYAEMAQYWRAESRKGAQLHTPDARLNAVYTGHLPIILAADFGHPDGSGMVNTSVGACTYGNYTNESVMIVEELEQRGLPEEVKRRLAIWVRYQGTVGLTGRFTDHDDVFFGVDGLESGQSYNQHHGWALWYLARHYLHTGDREWFAGVAESVVRGARWIARQRHETLGELPNSRGWERGFLPAGALEDVDDFFYWLSTNSLTWRGLDAAAEALERFGHPEAAFFRQEADAYRSDLLRGFKTSRIHSPLIRLRDGRWVPHTPSRMYCRGRDFGWIREVLEGSVYLIISGLYAPDSQEAGWILDDFLDTRYMNPPYGYRIDDPQSQWFDCGGFSVQPNLLAGLLPHLDRDEIEIYLWMFFNAWAACYREEVQAMVEHPLPLLGFSNSAPLKTSDEANAMKWLAYMFVYERGGLLHLGRALPRAWFGQEEAFSADRLNTPAGSVSLEYRPQPSAGKIEALVKLELRSQPEKVLLRFRHPERKPIRAVEIDGRPHAAFDAVKGDVELPAASGQTTVTVTY